MQFISVIDLKSNMDNSDNVKILDVRETYEFNICNIDTLNIPMAEIEARVDEIPRNKMLQCCVNQVNEQQLL